MQEEDNSFDMFLDDTKEINQGIDPTFGWMICTISVLTTMINCWAIRVLRTKESNCIKNLVILDSVGTILISLDTFYYHSFFWVPLNLNTLCAVRGATFSTLVVFTRLVPVAIGLLRYIMVCHPAFFINNGREQGILTWILAGMAVLCSSFWIYVISWSPINFKFLRCMGREEAFW